MKPETRVGMFLVPAGLPGTRIVETWDHLGLRASGSHDVIFEDVVFPLDHEIDVRPPDEWRAPDFTQATVHAIFIAAIYDGVARAARDWLVGFLRDRVPANLGAPLATLPRAQEVLGGIEARLAVNARLIGSFADDFDDDLPLSAIESNIVKLTVTNNAVAVVEDALSLAGNHGLSRDQSAAAALSRRAVRARSYPAGRHHPHHRRPPRARPLNISVRKRSIPMSVEFIGFISNNNSSETIVRSGPVLDVTHIETVAKAHEIAGFDRALLAFHSTTPDALQIGQHVLGITESSRS